MKIKTLSLLSSINIFTVVILLIVISFILLNLQRKQVEIDNNRLTSFKLADELLHSSDDLTRMARTYAATGDSLYKKYYYAILDIRNGKIPRPENYSQAYWYIGSGINQDNSLIPTTGDTISLQEMMLQAGIQENELALLISAESNSNELVNLELEAFAAIEGFYPDSSGQFTNQKTPDKEYAQALLHSNEYEKAKIEIMKPIMQFQKTVDKRIEKESIRVSRVEQIWLVTAHVFGLIGLLIIVLLRLSERKTILKPIYRLKEQVDSISKGNYSFRNKIRTKNELQSLGESFNNMAERVQDWHKKLEEEVKKQTEELLQLNAALEEEIEKSQLFEAELIAAKDKAEKNEFFMMEAQKIAHLGNWELDLTTNKLYWSDEIFRIFGCEPNEFEATYEKFVEFIHPDDREMVDKAYNDHLKNKQPYDIDHRILTKDKKVKYVNEKCRSEFDKNGNAIRSTGTVIDITELKIAEFELIKAKEKAEENEQRLLESQKVGKIGHYTLDLKTGIFTTSPELDNIFGINDSYTTDMDLWRKCLHPDDMEIQIHYLQKEVMIGHNPRDTEYRIYNLKTGGLVWIHASGKLRFDSDNNPVELFGTVQDITRQKTFENELNLAKERAELYIDTVQVIFVVIDVQGKITLLNRKGYEILGYSPGELDGANWFNKCISPERRDVALNEYKKIVSGEVILPSTFERFIYTKEGERRLILWHMAFIRDVDGKITGLLRAGEDVTKKREMEKQILEMNTILEERIKTRTAELEEVNNSLNEKIEELKSIQVELEEAKDAADTANRSKSEFLSRMSHELRTPMNAILGFAQLLGMSQLNQKQHENVQRILQGGQHLLSLINEVLDITRIEAGKLSVSVEPVKLKEVILEMIDTVSHLAENNNIDVKLIECSGCEQYVKADKQRLKQVLLNLINNAIKYNKPGGYVSISAEMAPKQNTGDFVRVLISDNGIGIKESDMPKLFNPFVRIGNEQVNIEGTGLGLTVSQKLIESMKGSIGVESKYGEGSTFWIKLPVIEYKPESRVKPGHMVALDDKISNKTGLILYIEDNEPNAELVQEIISSIRPNIKLITNKFGKNAVPLTIEHKPNLILLDLNLPDIHGNEVLKKLLAEKETAEIPVVVISADAMSKQIKKLLDSGATNYLTKPLDVKHFIEVIDKYL